MQQEEVHDLAQDPIVVYGAPRSGTTYLRALLSSHPAVHVSDETRVFAWLHHALALTQDDRMVLNERAAIVDHLRRALPPMIRDYYRTVAPEARYWGDKNPHYADPFNEGCLELLLELFPGSRFIHIIRDGRDVVSSLVRKEHDGVPWVTFEQAHFTWARHTDRGAAFGRKLPPDRYFELRYEDLIADDYAVAVEMFRFLGIEPDPAVEAFCRGQQQERTPFKSPTRNLENGVAVSDWSTLLSPEERVQSLNMIGSQLVRYGYETDESLAQLRERITGALAERK